MRYAEVSLIVDLERVSATMITTKSVSCKAWGGQGTCRPDLKEVGASGQGAEGQRRGAGRP
jgi:hypothetical protein